MQHKILFELVTDCEGPSTNFLVRQNEKFGMAKNTVAINYSHAAN